MECWNFPQLGIAKLNLAEQTAAMEILEFDLVVVGGGSAGYAAARTAREQFERVAIIDKGPDLGGLCILRGCMPSKTLIYSAEVLHLAQKDNLFGLRIPHAMVDMQALKKRKQAMVEDFASYRREQLQSDRFTLIRQQAHFVDKGTLELEDGSRVKSRHFIIATGSAPQFPLIPGLDPATAWTSDDVLDLDFLPESVIVLGGGVVACELAQYLNRIGTKVIQIQRSPRILKEASAEAAQVVEQAFRDEGIELYTDTQLERIEQAEDGSFAVHFQHQGAAVSVEAKHLFNALGRKPAVDSLNLDAAGIELAQTGHIAVNEFQQTTNPAAYACGDVAGPYEIVHIAILQGEVAARHALGRDPKPVNYDLRTGVVFTDPQIAEAGLPLAEAKQRGMDLVVADYPFDDHGKSILMEARYGYVKVWADRKTGRVIGAECVGKDAGELMHSMAVAVSLGASTQQLMDTQWYHPTLSEIWSYPIEDILAEIQEGSGS